MKKRPLRGAPPPYSNQDINPAGVRRFFRLLKPLQLEQVASVILRMARKSPGK